MRSLLRGFATLVTAAAVATLLVGCDPPAPTSDTVVIRSGPDGLEIAVCEDFHVRLVLFDYRLPDAKWVSTSWEDLDQVVVPGDRVDLPGPARLPDASVLVEGTEVYVIVNDGSGVADTRFEMTAQPIDENWLQPGGARTNDPCPFGT